MRSWERAPTAQHAVGQPVASWRHATAGLSTCCTSSNQADQRRLLRRTGGVPARHAILPDMLASGLDSDIIGLHKNRMKIV
jgi:hypothetical protein